MESASPSKIPASDAADTILYRLTPFSEKVFTNLSISLGKDWPKESFPSFK